MDARLLLLLLLLLLSQRHAKTCTHIAGGKKILINAHIHSDITQRVVNIIIVIPQRIPWQQLIMYMQHIV